MLHIAAEGPVVIATLDAPPANAIGMQELHDLGDLVERLTRESADTRVLVLRGEGRFFCGGVNIGMISETVGSDAGSEQVAAFGGELQRVFLMLESLPIPTIAAMKGSAVGGGLELALACDFRIVGADSSYGLPESKLGLIPGAGGTQRLTEVSGRGTSLRLILLGELVKGEEAVRLGIAQWVRANDEVNDSAMELARRLTELAPNALSAAKQCVTAARGESGFDLEIALTKDLLSQTDTTDRIKAFLAGSRQK